MAEIHGRPDLGEYEPGRFYRWAGPGGTEALVEFMGIAWGAGEETGEDLGVFRFVDNPESFILATKRGHQQGETFWSVADEVDLEDPSDFE